MHGSEINTNGVRSSGGENVDTFAACNVYKEGTFAQQRGEYFPQSSSN